MSLQTLGIALLAGLLTGAVPAWWLTADHYQGSIASMQLQATQEAAAAQAKAQTQYQEATNALNDVSKQYQSIIAADSKKNAAVVADLRSGARRLRVRVTSCQPVPDAATGAGQRDGATLADIQPAVAANLAGLAADADAITRQLAACQAVVAADRKAVNGD